MLINSNDVQSINAALIELQKKIKELEEQIKKLSK